MAHGGKRVTNKVKECVCDHCGAFFNFNNIGRVPKYCSTECRNKSRLKKNGVLIECRQCKKEFLSLKADSLYCSRKCAGAINIKETHYRTKHTIICPICKEPFQSIDRKQICCSPECASKYRGENAKKYYFCEYCREQFYKPNGYRIKYCSRDCLVKALHEKTIKNAERKAEIRAANLIHKNCAECGKKFSTGFHFKIYCSDECCYTGNLKLKREQWAEVYEPKTFICKECGIQYTTSCGNPRSSFCSDNCLNKYCNRMYQKNRKRLMKKAYRASVSFKKIYQRDEGICQICGLPVAYDTSSEKAWSATVDHIVPLSVGGVHHPDNCQLTHRMCNSMKLQEDGNYKIDWDELIQKNPQRWGYWLDEYKSYMKYKSILL